MLNNKNTPGGDGSRIFPYLQFVNGVGSFYPLWNPFKLGGVPTLADPERYILLGKFIDPKFEYANFQLNLVHIIATIILSFTAFLLAKEMSISQHGAAIVAIVLACSFVISRSMYCGRVNGIVPLASINLALYLFIKYLKTNLPLFLFLTAILTGYFLSTHGYYTLVHLLPLLMFAGWYYNRLQYNTKTATFRLTCQIIFIVVFGALSFSVFLLPMTYYQFQNYTFIEPASKLGQKLPQLGSLPNIFFPVKELNGQWSFPFVSLISLPLFIFFSLNRNRIKNKPALIFLFLFGSSLAILMGQVYPFKWLVRFFENTPALMQIRQAIHFDYAFTLSLAFLCGYGFDAIEVHESRRPWRKITPLLVILLFVLLTIMLDMAGTIGKLEVHSLTTYLEQSYILNLKWRDSCKYIVLLVLFIFPYTALNDKKCIKGYILLLLVIQLVFFKTTNDVKPVNNKTKLKKIAAVLNQDNSYYRIWGTGDWSRDAMGMPRVRALNGFSLYFSNEHRWQLENTLHRKVVKLRPHWVNIGAITDWNENVAKLSNLKYVISKNLKQQDALEKDKNWLLVESDECRNSKKKRKSIFKLYCRENWESALRVYGNWEVIPEVNGVLEKMSENNFDPFKKVFIEKRPSFTNQDDNEKVSYKVDIREYTEEEIIFEVTTNKNGVLFIPEYYDDGWKAKADGHPMGIIRANASFRGIPVAKGNHIVKMYYAPTIVYFGTTISVITILIGIFLSLFPYIKRRRHHCCQDMIHTDPNNAVRKITANSLD